MPPVSRTLSSSKIYASPSQIRSTQMLFKKDNYSFFCWKVATKSFTAAANDLDCSPTISVTNNALLAFVVVEESTKRIVSSSRS